MTSSVGYPGTRHSPIWWRQYPGTRHSPIWWRQYPGTRHSPIWWRQYPGTRHSPIWWRQYPGTPHSPIWWRQYPGTRHSPIWWRQFVSAVSTCTNCCTNMHQLLHQHAPTVALTMGYIAQATCKWTSQLALSSHQSVNCLITAIGTSAVLRLECSIDCISGSVRHHQNS